MNKQELAEYVVMEHHTRCNKKISAIKLQKSLYFLFAFWANKVGISKNEMHDEIKAATELSEPLRFDINLFKADFEAWGFGPVDRDIYLWFLNLDYDSFIAKTHELDTSQEVKDYIDELLPRIFNTADFSLVDLCQEDNCWRKVFSSEFKNKIMSEDIIEEYVQKVSI